ncbi:TIR domain-containing protein [Nostoc sp. KVJ3]|uniref:toll/interleukin-1 receptor domain-containing protein n=1 Tax=Nostoc sp. KVJ3 TaxID=457945 RepID=UPI0022382FB9|nr:toll/interleukin-1 receptor domain-containing protein [Nostoc sp. KVJ3]MCW5313450.1 TIR domain-containing protein [Nostoc sp. KVJ3]
MGVEVFFSYSHRDETLRDELAKHLTTMRRQKIITAWYDREITAGSEWADNIYVHLNSAQIILLLVSADFLASDYCYDIELKRAMERHETGEACVIPIILKPVDWQGAPFGKLQALPKNAESISTWADRDQAFLNVVQGIRRVVETIVSGNSTVQVASINLEQPKYTSQREKIQQQIQALQVIIDDAQTTSNVASVRKYFWQWRKETTDFLSEAVGKQESLALVMISPREDIKTDQARLINEATQIRNYLLALSQELT